MGTAITLLVLILAMAGIVGATHTDLACPSSVIVPQYTAYRYKPAKVLSGTSSGSESIQVTLDSNEVGAVEVGGVLDTAQTRAIIISYTATDHRSEGVHERGGGFRWLGQTAKHD